MKINNPYGTITRSQAVKTVLSLGKRDEWGKGLVCLIRGPMGSGKSDMLNDLARALPTHTPIFFDCTVKEAGDALMPKIIEKDGKNILTFVPADDLGFHLDSPVILFCDEIDKANRAIQNVTNRIFHEGKLGLHSLPEGSIVCGTSNRASEGLGDNRQANMRDRTVSIDILMPSSSEWIEQYALGANVHPTVLTTVSEITQMLQDFSEVSKAEDNPYIFHPDALDREHFTSCRSLDNASRALYRAERDNLPSDVIAHILSGIIGKPAAAEMIAIHTLHNDLPRYDDVIKSPTTAKKPDKSAAMCLFVYTAIQRAEPSHIGPLIQYLERLPLEQQAMFFFGVMRSPKAAALTPENGMIQWGARNAWTVQDNN